MSDCDCPYCGKPQKIEYDGESGEDEALQHQCDDCGKTFVYRVHVSYDYEAEKADCLNGAPHDWKPTATYPPFAKRMYCSMCDEHRQPTEEERKQHDIPTREEWDKKRENQ